MQQFTPQQQQQMYQRHLAAAQNDPAIRAQMQQQQQALYNQQRQMQAAMAQTGYPQGQQHLQPQFQQQQQQQQQQQRRPSPMGQIPQGQGQMGQPGQQNQMVGYGGMLPPSSGPMGGTMPQGMHPQQAYQQQMMRNANPQFAMGMNPQMASASPHPQNTPTRPSSQVQGTPMGTPGAGTPSNMHQMNNMTPPGQQPQMPPQNSTSTPQPQQVPKALMGPPESPSETSSDPSPRRVAALLELNNFLIKCANELQSQGKGAKQDASAGGQQSPITSTPTEATAGDAQSPSTQKPKFPENIDFIQCMRRIQVNIAYLMGSGATKRPMWPIIMEAIPNHPGLNVSEENMKQMRELYKKLRDLFPEYKPGINPATGQPGAAPGSVRPQVQQQMANPMINQAAAG